MKASRKLFTVMSVALPLMLVVAMTAHAESGSRGMTSEEIMKKAEECRMKGGDPQKEGESIDGIDVIKGVKCVRKSSASSSATSTPQSASVVCKRTAVKENFRFDCEDGQTHYAKMHMDDDQPMPPTTMPPPMGGDRCKEIAMRIMRMREDTKMNGTDHSKDIAELEARMKECSNSSTSTSTSSSPTMQPPMSSCQSIETRIRVLKEEMTKKDVDNSAAIAELEARLKTCKQNPVMDSDMVLPPTRNATNGTKGVSAIIRTTGCTRRKVVTDDATLICTASFCRGVEREGTRQCRTNPNASSKSSESIQ